jgi:hypothetical protein
MISMTALTPPAFRKLDDGRLMSCLAAWADLSTLRRILVANPARLYGFGSL